MSRAVFALFRVFEWLWRRRVFRALLWVFAALWLLDGAVYFLTESQWFASLEMGDLWRARVETQATLFGVFLLLCWLLARVFLGAVTKISPQQAPPLRGALSRFEPLRGHVARWTWTGALLLALFLARDFARGHWSDFLFARGGASSDFAAILGLRASLWTHFLPLFAPFLGALWDFSLGLFLLVAATGVVRALPLLAAREPLPPPVLPRTLWRLGAWLLFLRALGYAVQIFDLDRGKPLQSGDVFVSLPLWALGALACFLFAARALHRARANAPRRTARWTMGLGAALFAPAIANFLLVPARALMPETAWLRAQRENATRAAWNLHFSANPPFPAAPSIAQAWPVWDEKTLLQTRRGARFQNRQLVEWKSATLDFQNGAWSALLAGQKVGATAWTARRDADESTALSLQRLEFSPQNALSNTPLATSSAFFGLEGPSLFSNEPIGVPMRSWGAKWLWAWRLRDILLPFDGANFSHLLVFRGAAERARRLAPFWKLGGAPRLVTNGENAVWMLPLCATTSSFPGAMSAPSGELEGVSAASDSIQMRLDARSGAVSFFAVPASNRGDFLLDSWRRALPQTLQDAAQMPAPLRAKIGAAPEVLRAQIELESVISASSGEEVRVLPAQNGFDAARGEVTRVAAIGKNGWRVVEAANGEKILRRGVGDFAARLAAIDAQIAKIPRPNAPLEAGEPFLWPDERAPGGWWIARAFFTAPATSSTIASGEGARLWRVALTGADAGAKVSVGEATNAARLGVAPAEAAPPRNASGAPIPPEIEALEAHEAAQRAGRKGDWITFGRESARLKSLLEQLAARHQNGTPISPR